MLSQIMKNKQTTIAGIVGFLSVLGGVLGTYSTGRTWPALLGLFLKAGADAVAHALAADAGGAS